MNSDDHTNLVIELLETVDRLEGGHQIISLAHYQYKLDQVRTAIADSINADLFIIAPHLTNDGEFMFAVGGLSKTGKETLEEMKEQRTKQQTLKNQAIIRNLKS